MDLELIAPEPRPHPVLPRRILPGPLSVRVPVLRPSASSLSNEPVRRPSAKLALDQPVRLLLVRVGFRAVAGRVGVRVKRVLRRVVLVQVRVWGETLEETLARVLLGFNLLVVCMSAGSHVAEAETESV